MQLDKARLGSAVTIHARDEDGGAGELLGDGRVIHPQVVQVFPPLDARLSESPHRAEDFVIVTDRNSHPAQRIRPGLVSYAEAAEIFARELPHIELVPTRTGIVVLETTEWIADDPDDVCDSPWWCKVLCLSSCSSC